MDRIRTRLVTLTASCMVAAMVLLLVYWVVTSNLESWSTAVAAGGVTVLLGSIILLARRGQLNLSAGLLAGLVFFLVVEVSYEYGLGTPSIAAFVLPILLAAFTLGAWSCYTVTAASIATIWFIGTASTLGWYISSIPSQASDLTFTAPFYTLLFLLVAVISAEWSRSMGTNKMAEFS